MTSLSMNLKVIPRSYKGHKFILVTIDEVTNVMMTIPFYQSRPKEKGDALIGQAFSKYSMPACLIIGQDSAFMSTLIDDLSVKLGIKIKIAAPYNHQSLQAEHSIKSLATIL